MWIAVWFILDGEDHVCCRRTTRSNSLSLLSVCLPLSLSHDLYLTLSLYHKRRMTLNMCICCVCLLVLLVGETWWCLALVTLMSPIEGFADLLSSWSVGPQRRELWVKAVLWKQHLVKPEVMFLNFQTCGENSREKILTSHIRPKLTNRASHQPKCDIPCPSHFIGTKKYEVVSFNRITAGNRLIWVY